MPLSYPAGLKRPSPLTPKTVRNYVSSILTKLDLNNRVQIALLAHDAGSGPPSSS